MPLLVLLLIALGAGSIVAFVAWHYPNPGLATPTPAVAAAEAVGREIGHHSRLRRTLKGRLNAEVATGLALTIALALALVGGLILAGLAYLMRTNSQLVDIDASVAQWGADHAGPISERWLSWITHLGDTEVVIALAVILAVAESLRRPSRWIVPFLLVVILGQNFLTNGVKELLDRVRPDLNPIAETLGPSFPSGHSATAAAFYAAAALLLGRGRPSDDARLPGGERGRDRRRCRVHARPSRLPLAERRHRRARSRLGVVRRLRHRIRRSHAPVRRRCREGRRGGRRGVQKDRHRADGVNAHRANASQKPRDFALQLLSGVADA